MNVKDFDNFQSPNRKPWLLVLIIVLVGLFIYRRRQEGGDTEAGGRGAPTDDLVIEAVDAPREPSEEIIRARDVGFDRLISQAELREQNGDLAGARDRYLAALPIAESSEARERLEVALGKVSVKAAMTPSAMPEKQEYIVKRGDSVEKIARKFGTTIELIQKSNLLANPNLIKVGDRFLVMSKPLAIEVSKSRKDLRLYLDGRFFKRYGVGTGKFGKTPEGSFVIYDKIPEPPWWRPDGREIPYGDPKNILGTRWMAIRATGDTPDVRGYGIHGTWDDASIGKAESAGCIRMKNADVEELFVLVPRGTDVTIVP